MGPPPPSLRRDTLWARWVLQDGRELLQRDPRASVTNHLSPITNHFSQWPPDEATSRPPPLRRRAWSFLPDLTPRLIDLRVRFSFPGKACGRFSRSLRSP